MLKVQEYLKEKKDKYIADNKDNQAFPLNSLEQSATGMAFTALNQEFGIICAFHESEPLVILNYDQIFSKPETHPIVIECRGLVLNSETFDVVAKSFNRFFNLNQHPEYCEFDFNNFICDEKMDGSIVLIYAWKDNIFSNTRGTFGQLPLEGFEGTWEQAIGSCLTLEQKGKLANFFIKYPKITLVFEFCSLYNKVVRQYNTPTLFLLGVFEEGQELSWNHVNVIAGMLDLKRPETFEFKSIEEIEKYIQNRADNDPTFEGVVLRDNKKNRIKVKSAKYLALHKMKGGNNCFLEKNLVPFALSGESGELISIYPEVETKFKAVEQKINDAYAVLENVFNESKGIENQKEFALFVIGKTPFTGILFQLKKKFGKDTTVKDLKEIWRGYEDGILKVLFK